MKKRWQAALTFVLVFCLIVTTHSTVYSQDFPHSGRDRNEAPVVFNNETVFQIREKLGVSLRNREPRKLAIGLKMWPKILKSPSMLFR